MVVQRFKGLGEMNPSQLRETAMSPGTRRLIQLELGKSKTTDELLDMLLSKKRLAFYLLKRKLEEELKTKWKKPKGNTI